MKVLLAIDGSESAARAAELVHGIGWPAGSTIRVVSVIQPAIAPAMWLPGMITSPEAIDVIAASAVAQAASIVDGVAALLAADGRTVEQRVIEGRPASAIIDMARAFEPDLLVVGSHGRGRIASAVLGSVSAEVVEHASCPVLVARGTSILSLVLADDGSPHASAAEQVVATMPGFAGLPVRVVSVDAQTLAWYGWLEPEAAEQIQGLQDALAEEHERHSKVTQGAVGRLNAAGLVATGELRQGDPGHEIVAAANESAADLIVMGTHGQTGLTRLVLGSVARKVLQHAHCSVLIVRRGHGSPATTPPPGA
jgi:nucleotide-binding universal stress UspA family protein